MSENVHDLSTNVHDLVGTFDFDSLPADPEPAPVPNPAAYYEALPPRKSSPRSRIRWVPAVDNDETPVAGVVDICTARDWSRYVVSEFPTDFQGRGLHLRKLTPGTDKTEESYSVFIPRCGGGHLCECKGFTFARHCKHIDTIMALIENRWL